MWHQILKEGLKIINDPWDDAEAAANEQSCWKTLAANVFCTEPNDDDNILFLCHF